VITVDELRRLLAYDPETGYFTWLVTLCSKGPAGGRAGSKRRKGYIEIKIYGRSYASHRLAWFYVHGKWPPNHIDHINGVRDDNRIVNLRPATSSQNRRNSKCSSGSGRKGVYWYKPTGKWAASICIGGKNKYLGYFENIDDAADAYRRAAVENYGEFARV